MSNLFCRYKSVIIFVLAFDCVLPVLTQQIFNTVFNLTQENLYFEISPEYSEKEALDLLLAPHRYDNRAIPPSNGQFCVRMSVLLLSLAAPDVSSLEYEVKFLINMIWTDPRLFHVLKPTKSTKTNTYNITQKYDAMSEAWQQSMPQRRKLNYLNAYHHLELLWKPELYYAIHGTFGSDIDPARIVLQIYANGTVKFTTRQHLILLCQGNFAFFPFDSTLCVFQIESVSYETGLLEFEWLKEGLQQSTDLGNFNANLGNSKTTKCISRHERGNYSCLRVELSFPRHLESYFSTVFIPGILLVTSSMLSFWLEWDAVPDRIMLGVTVMLAFFTTSSNFRATLPVVSDLTTMNMWDGVSMLFILAALLEFIVVNYIGRKSELRSKSLKLPNDEMEGAGSPVGSFEIPHHLAITTDRIQCTCGASAEVLPTINACTVEPEEMKIETVGQEIYVGLNKSHGPTQNQKMRSGFSTPLVEQIDCCCRIAFPSLYIIFLSIFFIRVISFQYST